jgi:hypothetical protein
MNTEMDTPQYSEQRQTRNETPMKKTAAQLWLKQVEKKTGEDCCKKLVELVLQREKDVLGEMGDFRMERMLAEEYMDNDFSARLGGPDGDIFQLRNETMGLIRSGIGFIVARIQDDLFGSLPWFAAIPEGTNDTILAGKIYEHSAWKLREAKFQDHGEDVVERVMNFGEAILRTSWKRDVQKYHRLRSVLIGPDGEPVLTSTGDYAYEEDEWEEQETPNAQRPTPNVQGEAAPEAPVVEQGESGNDLETDGGAAETMGELGNGMETEETGEGALVLVKDPTIVMGEGMHFEEMLIEEEEVRYNGLDPQTIDWKNFRCAPSFADIEDADFRGHVYEMRFSALKAKVRQASGVEEEDWDAETVAMFDKIRNDTTASKDEARTQGTSPAGAGGDEKNPLIKCLDFEMEWDPEGEGNPRLLFGTVLMDSEQLFYVEYGCNILPAGKSVYTVVAAYSLPGRWPGRGWWKLYEDVQNNADRIFNSILHRNEMNANPMIGVHEEAIKGDVNDVVFRPGARVDLEMGKRMTDFADIMVMPNADAGSWQLLEFFMKLNQLETGVTSSAQGGLGDMPATSTATGIQSVLASGSTLHKRPARAIRDGLADALWKLLTLLYSNHDADETFNYGEGENAAVATLTREDVKNLRLNVRLTMTRFRQREVIEHSQQAIQVHTQYLALPESEKAGARPLYVELLRNLDIPGSDKIIREPVQLPPPVDDTPPAERINISYKDLPPEGKEMLMESVGLPVGIEAIQAYEDAIAPKGKERPTPNAQRPTPSEGVAA